MKPAARACLAAAPLLWACELYEHEGMALKAPLDAIVVGDTMSLSVVDLDGAMSSPLSVLWKSSDSTIATIDDVGLVTGIGPGLALVEARTGDYTLRGLLQVWGTAGPFVSLHAGADFGCGLAEDGIAWCWGADQYGQLGTGFPPERCYFTRDAFLPCSTGAIPVGRDLRFTDLAVGHYHACGLSTSGAALCWGLNDGGQVGSAGGEIRPNPAPVDGAHVFTSLAAGGRTTCGITEDRALVCWGGGLFRVDGPPADALTTPTRVAPEHRFALVATVGVHTCALTVDGATWCWGNNGRGQLGVASVDSICGSATPCTREPQELTSAPPFVDLALGQDASCGLTAGGVAYCWGANGDGQLGDGTRADHWEPRPVAGLHTFARIDADQGRACGLDVEGLLHCWGSDPTGFGNGGDAIEVDRPVPAGSGLAFMEIAMGLSTQCGVAPSGITWCWGSNVFGTLGNGRTDRSRVTAPTRVIRHPIAN